MDKNDLRNKLNSIATRLFAERGLNGVSIRKLSQTAGVSISMISYHFGGKEGLYSSVLQEQFSDFDQEQRQINDSDSEALEKIEAYIRVDHREYRTTVFAPFLHQRTYDLSTIFFFIVQPADKVIQILVKIIEEGIFKQIRKKI